MTAEEKEEILRDWHPDFKMDQKRELRIGPSAGELMPHEVADILEAHPVIKSSDVDLSDIAYDLDVLVIGA
ncbi:MAG: succinate dehydrogenase/fumarate reductase flavoprotein subunit, partial [Thermoplasmata archaeon]|nr:succinate dehydrogenase/fumarate reductase flavoprotein subunit [Thermoplasmata archaeon]NIT79288.1 succinate dehydrogenase/fumarate reductase flavoprotein subunit [Thermoplasmata archaeon]NIV80448.1 succinate dehydrogenase/fumarate reductase flavoprotein subunit [Thermoplasmata archaeon]NIW90550.1 succinate dehydrogenase/fumarate reductase flavoprotein subunit [Thermoplasmata archaeon]NIY05656.1 succinate dehydrogenase/fumarate reductase flavoprotein subunit [Thermoplasmata archaeon]